MHAIVPHDDPEKLCGPQLASQRVVAEHGQTAAGDCMPSLDGGSTQQACHPQRSPGPEGSPKGQQQAGIQQDFEVHEPAPGAAEHGRPPGAAAGKQGRATGPAAAAAGPDQGADKQDRADLAGIDMVFGDEEEEEGQTAVKRRRSL